MTIKKWQIGIVGSVLSATVLAGTMDSRFEPSAEFPFVASLNLGPAWTRPGETKTLALQPDVQKTYVPFPVSRAVRLVSTAKGTEAVFTGELFLGVYGLINSAVQGQIGLALGATSSASLKGNIWEDANPFLSNYTYSYSVSNKRIALKGKLLYDINTYDLFPYISGSAGVAINNSSGFTINPKIVEEVPAPAFANHSEAEFSYTLGIGLEAALDMNWRVGLGYEYADWGLSSLGPGLGQMIGHGISLKSIRTHELLISLSYLA